MNFKFGKKTSEDDPLGEAAAIDGPDQPLEIHTPPPGTKRLSKKGQFMLLGGAATVVSAMLIGVMISGKSNSESSDDAKQKQIAAVDAPGQSAAYKESPEEIARRAAVAEAEKKSAGQVAEGQQPGPLTTRAANQSGGGQAVAVGSSPPSPAEAHRLWLQKRKYERMQGQLMAADSAETSEIGKGGAMMAVKAAVGGASNDAENDNGAAAGLSQRLTAANARAAIARSAAAVESARAANMPFAASVAGNSSPSAAIGAFGTAGLDPAVAAQSRNKAFMKEAADNGYLPELLKSKMGEFELTAGSVIPAVMLSGINSDLPGTIVAQTRQTVYSTNAPDAVLIPQGSRLIGRYSADVAYGQERVLAAWDELILPNGSRISLRGMAAADGQGQSGIEDQVNNHFWKTWSSALLVSLLGVAAQQSQPQNQGAFNTPSGSAQAAGAAMNSLSDVSSKILQKSLNISPTLQVRPGMTFNVMVNRSIILPTYR